MPTIRLSDFDTWRPGYGGATVFVYRADSEQLADIFLDEDRTVPAQNPQILLSRTMGEIVYGKWSRTVYADGAVQMRIDSVDQTGVIRPGLTTVDGEDSGGSIVTVDGGEVAFELGVILARRIDVRDYGPFLRAEENDASAAEARDTLLLAIGVAAGRGGGVVHVPDGYYQLNSFEVPEGVVIEGQSEQGTVLQSTNAGIFATIAGRAAGFRNITLDGVSQVAGSIGVQEIGSERAIYDNVTLKRFERGRRARGLHAADTPFLTLSDNIIGADIRGDTDENASGQGCPAQGMMAMSGVVEHNREAGIRFERIDAETSMLSLKAMTFTGNTGTALEIIGARNIDVENAVWTDNTRNIVIRDAVPADPDKTSGRITFRGGVMVGGEIRLSDTLDSVVFEGYDFRDVDVFLTSPKNNVLVIDCAEDRQVTLNGIATSWVRQSRKAKGAATGITTGNAPTRAWGQTLAPGQRGYFEAKVIARGRSTEDSAYYHIAVSASRAGSQLAFENQTQNFTSGSIITGQTSGATARVYGQTDNGTTGLLYLQDIIGAFLDNEIITDTSAGSATVNGSLVSANVALVGAVTALRPAQESDAAFDATFVANGPELELRVTGNTGKNVEWLAEVEALIA